MKPSYRTPVSLRPDSEPRAAQRLSGLDGLRGIAVSVVLVFHFFPQALPGGFVGVDVFFVISGFLITGLLVDEYARSRRISLRRFWGRRVRRLVPPLVPLVLICCTVAWMLGGDVLVGLGWQVLGAATFGYNWVSIAGSASYFSATSPEPVPEPLVPRRRGAVLPGLAVCAARPDARAVLSLPARARVRPGPRLAGVDGVPVPAGRGPDPGLLRLGHAQLRTLRGCGPRAPAAAPERPGRSDRHLDRNRERHRRPHRLGGLHPLRRPARLPRPAAALARPRGARRHRRRGGLAARCGSPRLPGWPRRHQPAVLRRDLGGRARRPVRPMARHPRAPLARRAVVRHLSLALAGLRARRCGLARRGHRGGACSPSPSPSPWPRLPTGGSSNRCGAGACAAASVPSRLLRPSRGPGSGSSASPRCSASSSSAARRPQSS
ncbi:acyltransferase family protein [Cryobacterium breve]|uniref:Acyltransferase family protein n=1 Tax=Cryobacterium breve TaxID=1259258 RepID=A0ABY7NF54_9MICO|nr:acyltransferase family protein [Cryobacterium breve]